MELGALPYLYGPYSRCGGVGLPASILLEVLRGVHSKIVPKWSSTKKLSLASSTWKNSKPATDLESKQDLLSLHSLSVPALVTYSVCSHHLAWIVLVLEVDDDLLVGTFILPDAPNSR